ncbi:MULTISPECIES: hypothetical protein [unclassified Coleofasciculus]|uniref:hypothetical protein n=1 Tax=unclassified Coleofasciculus TaxID=2692782 RepID=UPI00187FB975|nr:MULTISPECIES: hypothetical protein [unclassified Coleofasciculus]MBE9124670.1 hypothetical protein [Coleofasciculus sp. LEGE 07081]MBE9146997.1 hypothetical protein [Coleofasciculus sp. LEGE 07092]
MQLENMDESQLTVLERTQYEFNDQQNLLFQELANKMLWVSRFLLWLVIPLMITFAFDPDENPQWFYKGFHIFNAVLYFFISRFTARAAKSFRRIIETESNDIKHLMNAIEKIRKLYWIQRLLVEISVFLVGIVSVGIVVYSALFR